MKYALIVFVLIGLASVDLYSCTTFCLADGGQAIFGRNYDWHIGSGMLMVNKRSVLKMARPQENERLAKWTSKYGSVTFNQYGREFPTGGINQAGLVVELMMMEGSQYPVSDRRPVVGALEWIQYQLDSSKSIAEVIQKSQSIRISSTVGLHYLVCERSGSCLTVEFLDGKLVSHAGNSLPVPVLTNDTYENSLQYLRNMVGFGGPKTPSNGNGSLDRFARTATMLKNYKPSGKDVIDYGFEILGNVANGSYTKWSIIYDLKKLRFYFRTESSKQIKYLDVENFDFECSSPVWVLNIDTKEPGDVFQRFQKYSTALNRALITQSYKSTSFLTTVPDSELESLTKHPETFSCRSH